MHRREDITVKSLFKINKISKLYKNIKQEAYEAKNYAQCGECKMIEKKLYLLKALTLVDLEKKGVIKRGTQQVDKHGTVLETFYSEKYSFHAISQLSECQIANEYTPNDSRYVFYSKYYKPYETFLVRQLSADLKELYHLLENRNMHFSNRWHDKYRDALENLEETTELTDIEWGYSDIDHYMELYISGIKICDFILTTWEDAEGDKADVFLRETYSDYDEIDALHGYA